jgi:hypothetical protein
VKSGTYSQCPIWYGERSSRKKPENFLEEFDEWFTLMEHKEEKRMTVILVVALQEEAIEWFSTL